jgi:molecular chaperone DnaK
VKYIGIDLGTTNSVICSFDGEVVRIHESPDAQKVTPSVIHFDRRGRKFYGVQACELSARDPGRTAQRFKRMMGTRTPIRLPAANVTLTPEECSAEILRVLFGYLPEDARRGEDTGTVITVPAAFNQMAKDSTMSAADGASIGRVALIQEPAAAVMSVMRTRKADGIFVVYDLGGGTLDIAVAKSTSGKVQILALGGIEMCGGRDFDLKLFDHVVKPWLLDNYNLPEDFASRTAHERLRDIVMWAIEKAKIELSENPEARVFWPNPKGTIRDESGTEIQLDIPITRSLLDELISPTLEESIQRTRETLEKADLEPGDVERIVFVGGPTCYQPLRDKVASGVGIPPANDINPMTAVAEGAAIFAESIDWSSRSRGRKSSKATINVAGEMGLFFTFTARTPEMNAKVLVRVANPQIGCEFQIDSRDTGWQSGRIKLEDALALDLPLSKSGVNTFSVSLFGADGRRMPMGEDGIVISRTLASVEAIASHRISVAAREKPGGRIVLVPLVEEGDRLPKKGTVPFRSEESLKPGSANSIRFILREGGISEPINQNRPIGTVKINGSDLDEVTIPAGAELICEYEILDSGCLWLRVSVPSIHGTFRSHNFYSRQEGLIDYSQASDLIADQAERVLTRLAEIEGKIQDPRLDQARAKIDEAQASDVSDSDPERARKSLDRVQEAKELIALTCRDNLSKSRKLDLDKTVEYFHTTVREHARPAEVAAFESLTKTAQREIPNPSSEFESHLHELRRRNYEILWRHGWYVVRRFKWLAKSSHLFPTNTHEHARLVAEGNQALKDDDMVELRSVVEELDSLTYLPPDEDELIETPNILRG